MARVQVVQQQARVQRKPRSPKHSYYISHRPFQITPFMIAPVLPGETLKNLNVQGRAISDPLAVGMGNILPWWHEFFFFYVKLRDLDARDDIERMFLEGTSISSLVEPSADGVYFHTRVSPRAHRAQAHCGGIFPQ